MTNRRVFFGLLQHHDDVCDESIRPKKPSNDDVPKNDDVPQ